MSEPKSALITNMVHQLKSGEISKAQLFKQLSSIQAEDTPSNPDTKYPSEPRGEIRNVHETTEFFDKPYTTPPSYASGSYKSTQRRLLIEQLIAEKAAEDSNPEEVRESSLTSLLDDESSRSRFSEQRSTLNSKTSLDLTPSGECYGNPPPSWMSHAQDERQEQSDHQDQLVYDDYDNITSTYPTSLDPSSLSLEQEQEQDQDQAHPLDMEMPPLSKFTYPRHERPVSRKEQTEFDIRMNHMSECTFTPTIHELPSQYGNSREGDIPFLARLSRWKQNRENEVTTRQQAKIHDELEQCTFKPKIDPTSDKLAQKRWSGHKDVSISERLFKEAKHYELRNEAALLKKERQEEIDTQECTFKPLINHAPVRETKAPKKVRTSEDATTTNPELDECTFKPFVNPIPSTMDAAYQYVQTPIFERLTRGYTGPVCKEMDNEEIMFDDNDAYPVDSESVEALSRPSSAPKRLQQSDKPVPFEKFLKRLDAQTKIKQEQEKERLAAEVAAIIAPTANPKSKSIMKGRADFTQRLALAETTRRIKSKSANATMEACTFKPSINKKSAAREPRSYTELSRGDLLKRETSTRFLKLKLDHEEMAAMTFQPTLNKKSMSYSGKLRLNTEPETYVQRIQSLMTRVYSEKQRQVIQEQEMEEFAQCTFKPQIHQAPAYVTRIAHSMALTKAARAQIQKPQQARPGWK